MQVIRWEKIRYLLFVRFAIRMLRCSCAVLFVVR